jgi:hypothetical protein
MKSDANILSELPAPAARPVSLRVTPAAEVAIAQAHPWVFDQAITDQNHEGQPGDLAVIYRSDRRFLALGLYDPTSNIRVRIIHRGKPTTIDQAWFDAAILKAINHRASLEATGTTGYRLVHGVGLCSRNSPRIFSGAPPIPFVGRRLRCRRHRLGRVRFTLSASSRRLVSVWLGQHGVPHGRDLAVGFANKMAGK